MARLDVFGNPEPLNIYVTRVDGEILGCINDIIEEDSASLTVGLNQQYSLEFTATKTDGNDWYDYLHEGMYLLVQDVGLFRMRQPSISLDGQKETKSISASSCDSELEDKTCSVQINMGLKTSLEYLVKYNDEETETLVNPYTDIPYDWIVLYNTFPAQLMSFKALITSGHFGTPDGEGIIDVINDELISELSEVFRVIPRIKNKVVFADDESDEPTIVEYVTTTYDPLDPETVAMYQLLSGITDRIDDLISYYEEYGDQLSLLSIVLENTAGAWTVGDIYGLDDGDYSVCNMKYQFDINESIYSFLTQTLAETTNCLVSFDILKRKVNVTPIDQVGNDTGIVMSYDNLVNTLDIGADEDKLSTRLRVSGGEGLDISRVNFGSNYIDDLAYKVNAVGADGKRIYVSDDLAQKYMDYVSYRETKRVDYIQLSKDYASYQEQISELENRVPNDNLQNDWSTFSMEELEASLTAFKNLLAALEALYKEDYGTEGFNGDGSIKESFIKNTEYWYDYVAYKNIIEEIECAIDVFPYYSDTENWTDAQIEEYEELIKAWETEWSLYGIKELQAKIAMYKQNMDIMLQVQDPTDPDSDGASAVILKEDAGDYVIKTWNELTTAEKALYGNSELLYRYNDYDKIYSNWSDATEYLEGLIEERDNLQELLDQTQEDRLEVLDDVSLETCFTDDERIILYRLFQDAEYTNDNIITTSIDSTSEQIDRMVELLEDAKDQASLVSRPQLTFSVSSDNVLYLPEFEPFWDYFVPGNYILVQYKDDTYVRLRMIGYTFNPLLPTSDDFDIVFSNFVRSRAYYRDWASIFHTSATSISSAYSGGGGGGGAGGGFGESDDIDITISNTMLAKMLNTAAFSSKVNSVIQGAINSNVLSARLATFTNAKIGNLEVNKANIDLANVNNAWIESGVIKDAAITDAQILGVSANKLTAGTINASVINVANLRASNLIVDKINGQPVFGGYSTVNRNASGYSSKNPQSEGWYEFYQGDFVLSSDTSVDPDKIYYSSGAQVALYDQNYIDGLENTLNQRIDGTIQTYTGSEVPTLSNYPYTDWYDTTTSPVTDNRAEHVGDIYYVINASSSYDGYCYRFAYDNSTSSYGWVLIKDSDVTAALADISELQTFQSTTSSWIDETDESLTTIRTNHTTLEGIVNKTIVSTTQLWYAKSNTTAPSKPSAHVTTNSASTYNSWNRTKPTYNSSYKHYFYCYEWEYLDGTYGWSGVTKQLDIDTTDVKKTTQLWYSKENTTAPSKPNAEVTSFATAGGAWRIVVPPYDSTYPYYYYCYQYELENGTFYWSDVVYDAATSENHKNAPGLSQVAVKVDTSTFSEIQNSVNENSATITTLSTIVTNNGLSSSTNITNTVNSVSQKADSNESKISNLTSLLQTNADGTTASTDIVHQVSSIGQDLSGITTRVGKTEAKISGHYATSSTAAATDAKEATITPSVTGWELYSGATVTVKFTYANTSSSPTLSINETTAKTIKGYDGGSLSEEEYKWAAGDTVTFIYDGTYWLMQNSSTAVTRLKTAETTISQTANNVLIKATESDTTAAQGGAHIISSLINVATSGVTIDADKVNISGAAIFTSGRLSEESLSEVYSGIRADIPTAVSDLTNDSGFQTSSDVSSAISSAADDIRADIPTAVSDLTNDSGFQTSSDVSSAISNAAGEIRADIPTAVSELTNDSGYQTSSDVSSAISTATSDMATNTSVSATYAAKTDAVDKEQYIYIQATAGTASVSAYPSSATTSSSYWVTAYDEPVTGTPPGATSGQTPHWTTKRPTYQKNYPVIFIAKQRITVSGTITCTTPRKDDTLTIIDGGHITTGTIDASQVTVANINASNITTGCIMSNSYNGSNGSITNTAGSIINLDTDSFNFAGGRIVYDGQSLVIRSDDISISSLSGGTTVYESVATTNYVSGITDEISKAIDELGTEINGGYDITLTSDDYDDSEVSIDKSSFYDGVDQFAIYTAVTTSAGDNPSEHGWYELVSGIYVLTEDTSVEPNKTYYSKEPAYGTYAFTYNGTNWLLEGSSVQLEEFGITLNATPSSGDAITVEYSGVIGSIEELTRGQDLLSGEIVASETRVNYNIQEAQGELTAMIADVSTDLSALTADTTYGAERDGLITELKKKTDRIQYTPSHGLVLYSEGADTNTGLKMQLTGSIMAFVNGALSNDGNSSSVVAYVSGDRLYIPNATITSDLRLNNFAFIPRENGNMCLKYLG